VSQAGVAEAI